MSQFGTKHALFHSESKHFLYSERQSAALPAVMTAFYIQVNHSVSEGTDSNTLLLVQKSGPVFASVCVCVCTCRISYIILHSFPR